MKTIARTLLIAAASAAFLMSASSADAQFSKDQLKCRQTIGKSAAKLASTMAKTLAGCHKSRAKDGALVGTDCNDSSESQADTKGKIKKARDKFTAAVGGDKDKCAGINPSDVLYGGACPPPCYAVGTLSDMATVSTCLQCLVENAVEDLSTYAQGTPSSPLTKEEAKCNDTIGKWYGKALGTAIKELTKCQSSAEKKESATTTTGCVVAYPNQKVIDAVAKAREQIGSKCALSPAEFANLDSCASTQTAVRDCVSQQTQAVGGELGPQILELSASVTTTTTSTSTTTTTTLGAAAPECPVRGELTLWAGVSREPCATNGDCTFPRTCDTGLGVCTTPSRLDSGFTGLGHDGDIDDMSPNFGFLNCPGAGLPTSCGVCAVTGIDPAAGNCRCENDNRQICDKPFQADAVNCGGDQCFCYFGAPLPLNASGAASVCAINRFSENISGTADVDLGAGEITAKLRTKVYNTTSQRVPCPFCGGSCSGKSDYYCTQDQHCQLGNCQFGLCANDSAVSCGVNADCSLGTCTGLDTTPNDGSRDGVCGYGINAGQPCDVMSNNTTFPAAGGGGASLDCFPDPLANQTGAGLRIELTQTTGTAGPIAAQVSCGGAYSGYNCPCRVCSLDTSVVCNTTDDCTAVGAGTCTKNGGSGSIQNKPNECVHYECSLEPGVTCTNDGACTPVVCGGSTCTLSGQACTTNGDCTIPNNCSSTVYDAQCTNLGGGIGECTGGPTDNFCDGRLRADGTGIISCSSNADCIPGGWGLCTLSKRRSCYPDPLSVSGTPDPDAPVGAAVFCVPPTGSGTINAAAGLPGLGKVVNQASSVLYCADGSIYTPGSPNCPTP